MDAYEQYRHERNARDQRQVDMIQNFDKMNSAFKSVVGFIDKAFIDKSRRVM